MRAELARPLYRRPVRFFLAIVKLHRFLARIRDLWVAALRFRLGWSAQDLPGWERHRDKRVLSPPLAKHWRPNLKSSPTEIVRRTEGWEWRPLEQRPVEERKCFGIRWVKM